MEHQKKFSGALFGFKKEDVNTYILALSQDFSAQIKDLKNKNNELTKKNAELSAKLSELVQERAFISDTLLKAKHEAEVILENAQEQARQKHQALEAELQAMRATMAEEEKRLDSLRSNAKAALSLYAEQLGKIEI